MTGKIQADTNNGLCEITFFHPQSNSLPEIGRAHV